MKTKYYRIAQVGTFDCKNYGDLLFPDILSTELSKRLNIEEIVLFSPIGGNKPFDTRNVLPLAGLEKEHKKKPFDAIVCGGGDILRMDAKLVRTESKYEMTSMSADMWIYPMMLGKKYHIPVVLNAPGAPSRFWGNEKEVVKMALKEADYACTRDARSAALLSECSDQEIIVTPDSVFLVQQTYPDQEIDEIYMCLKEELDLPEKYFIFQTCILDHQLSVNDYEEKLRMIEKWMDARCLFMPIGYVHDDVEVMNDLNRACKEQFSFIEKELSLVEMLAVIKHSRGFVGTSMHGCLTSMVYQRPAIAINSVHSTKLHGLFEMASLPQCDVNSLRDIDEALLGFALTDDRKREIICLVNEHFDRIARIIETGSNGKQISKEDDDSFREMLRLILHPDMCFPTFSKIYYRSDNNYNEGNTRKIPFSIEDSQISFEIDIPLDTREIRFDPIEYSACIVSDLHVQCAGEDVEARNCNGQRLGDVFVFASSDPWLVLPLPQKHDGRVTVRCGILLIKKENCLAEKMENLFKEGVYTEETMDELKKEIREAMTVLAEIKEQTAVREGQQQAYEQMCRELIEKERESSSLSAEIEKEREKNKQIRAELDERERAFNGLTAYHAQVEEWYRKLSHEYNSVLGSMSWRITKPVRYTLDKLKANRYTGIVIKGLKYLKAFGIKETCRKVRQYIKNHKSVKIRRVTAYNSIAHMIRHMSSKELREMGVKIYLPDVLAGCQSNDGKRLLLATHELALTGGPMAVRYFAECLKEQGYTPVVISPSDGRLAKILEQDGIPTVVYPSLYTNEQIIHIAKLFDLIVLNTIVNAPIINALSGMDIPILWWIHEAQASYHPGALANMPEFVSDNVHIRTGGAYAAKQLRAFRPSYVHENLLYCVPEQHDEKAEYKLPAQAKGKIVMAVIGQLDERKGQRILVQAIRMLPESVRKQCYFVFIGKKSELATFKSVDNLIERYPDNACHIDEVTPKELQSIYDQMDCLICSSTDDPMPIVVTQAWMHEKMVICSENTGSASFIRKENAGYVYCDNDESELAACIERYAKAPAKHAYMKTAGRRIYDQEFSAEVFKKNAIELVEKILKGKAEKLSESEQEKAEGFNGIVSIVIPTYNAGEQWREFLRRIGEQKGVDEIEVVVVDSGSRDQTVAISKQYGATVVEIPQEQFSHSYARNLGAESAKGDILIFMTQDALPADENWVKEMVQPIVSKEAAAVSCKEQCPDGTEMYYRINSWGHIQFQGILEQNQLGSGREDESCVELRPRASLNDVACAVDKRIFKRFYYRFSYGEDLDLGIRLLRNGFKVKLLSSTVVIHGHNRTAGYILKRGYAESAAMGRMSHEWMPPTEDEGSVARKIVRGTLMLNAAIESTRKECGKTMSKTAFFEQFEKNLMYYRQASEEQLNAIPMAIDDPVLMQCNAMMRTYMSENAAQDDEIMNSTIFYLNALLIPYLTYIGISELDNALQEKVYESMVKRYCMMTGNTLARIDVNSRSYEKIQQMTHGV